MGGKTWQEDEERYYWLRLIPMSPEGLDPTIHKKSWGECAVQMQRDMGPRGYRKYGKQMIYEHFYQNCVTGRMSPRSRHYVTEYLKKRGERPIERASEAKASRKEKRAADALSLRDKNHKLKPASDDSASHAPLTECKVSSKLDHAGARTTSEVQIPVCSANKAVKPGSTPSGRVPLPMAPMRQHGQHGNSKAIRLPSIASLLGLKARACHSGQTSQAPRLGPKGSWTRLLCDSVSNGSRGQGHDTGNQQSSVERATGMNRSYCHPQVGTSGTASISGFEALLAAAQSHKAISEQISDVSRRDRTLASVSFDGIHDDHGLKKTKKILEVEEENKENRLVVSN